MTPSRGRPRRRQMDHARWRALENGFATAVALQGDEREQWLAALNATDPSLAREIRSLLDADSAPGAIDRIGRQLVSLHWLAEEVEDGGATWPADFVLPARIGPYIVAREIGRGGMGLVCQAHDPRLGRDVALKIFPRPVAGEAGADIEDRVLAEARAASALDHANICTIYDVGSLHDGLWYLAMAYYGGGTLAERLTAGPLAARDATTIASQIADALACAHAAGIVHRDVKPRNVAFGDRGETKLLDFGVALLRHRSGAPGSAGTPAYMAPEQVRGESVDARADVWALGVVLFEMLAGQRPFRGSSRQAVVHAVVHDDPPDLLELRADVPPTLRAIVRCALAKEPGDRFAGAAEMAAALRDVFPVDGHQRLPRKASRRRRAIVAVGIIAAVGLSGLVVRQALRPNTTHVVTTDVTARDMFIRARERYVVGGAEGTEEAIRLLASVLTRDPNYAPAHALLARSYVRSVADGMSRQGVSSWADTAIVHARRAIVLAPASPDGYAALGFAHASMVRHTDAVPQYLRALELNARHTQTMMDLARSYMALDRFDEAVAWQERALAIDPLLPGARVTVIGRYNVWELFEHARRHIDAALRLVPTDVGVLSQGMITDLFVGDTVSARRRLAMMVPLLTPAERARMGITFELAVDNPAGARVHVDRIAGTGSTSQDFVTYGMVYRATGDRARGDSLLRLRIAALRVEDRRLGHKSTQVAAALAHAYSALGQRDASLSEFARWDALGGVASRRRMAKEPGWAALRSDPRWEPIIARMDARFQKGRELIQARLVREVPLDSAARAREVQMR